jgi:transcriptional regulator with PAS, ATPase and Fis domain
VLPPLRERKEDLGLLVDHFVQCAAETLKKKKPRLPEELILLLETYSFPGNIRELQAMVFDAIAQNDNGILSLGVFRKHISRTQQDETMHHKSEPGKGIPITFADPLPTIKQATRMLVKEAMHRSGNNQSTAASLLGISQQALSKRLKNME